MLIYIADKSVLLLNGLPLHTTRFIVITDKANSMHFNLREDMLFFLVFTY